MYVITNLDNLILDFGESIIYNGLTGNTSIRDKNIFYTKEQVKIYKVNFLPFDLVAYEWKYDGNDFFENKPLIEEDTPIEEDLLDEENSLDVSKKPIIEEGQESEVPESDGKENSSN